MVEGVVIAAAVCVGVCELWVASQFSVEAFDSNTSFMSG